MEIDAYTKRNATKSILLAQLLVESLDDMKQTTLYNSSVKNLVNKLENVLHPFCRRYYDKIYNNDVASSIDVFDAIIDNLVHSIIIDIEPLKEYNLYVLKDSNNKKITIKSQLTPAEFEKQYNLKLNNLITKNYG